MSPRSLFIIILKVLGILFLKDLITNLPYILSVFSSLGSENGLGIMGVIFITLLNLAIYSVIPYCLLFKSEWILTKLKLDEGLEEETLVFQVHRSVVLSISVILLGGVVLVNSIPEFCRELITYIRFKEGQPGLLENLISSLVLTSVKIIIGLLLLGHQRQIVNFIEARRKR